ncbi:MAG: NIPSNAP family protein [Acidimicrobiales bacterium]
MLWELRQYRAKPGQRDNLVRWMEEEVIPFQTSKGIVIAGSFVGEDEDDLYVWIRRFDDEAHRAELYAAVYESDHWKDVLAPQAAELIDRDKIVVTRLEPTPLSVLR